jgi:hypothetical protein
LELEEEAIGGQSRGGREEEAKGIDLSFDFLKFCNSDQMGFFQSLP